MLKKRKVWLNLKKFGELQRGEKFVEITNEKSKSPHHRLWNCLLEKTDKKTATKAGGGNEFFTFRKETEVFPLI